jgi:hypothetical protein
VILAAPAFAYLIIKQQHPTVFSWEWIRDRVTLERVIFFGATLVPFVLILFWYNAVRFGGPLETGLDELYPKYEGQIYTIYLKYNPSDRFGEFDLRNVPLHLYTIFLMPPTFEPAPFVPAEQWDNATWLRPSEYGMSVLLTSPVFAYAVLVRNNKALRNMCWIAIGVVAIPTLIYYSQGWVQFGYRYLMDYLPFIMILTALGVDRFRSPRSVWIVAILVVISVAIGFWGRYWGTSLEW